MADTSLQRSISWKKPNELIRLQRQEQKKRRLLALNSKKPDKAVLQEQEKNTLLVHSIAEKRKNPFAKLNENAKKIKTNSEGDGNVLEQKPSTLSALGVFEKDIVVNAKDAYNEPPIPSKLTLKPFDIKSFSKLFQQIDTRHDDNEDEEEQKYTKHLPMDWSLKTRLRFFCKSELPPTQLKTHQIASSVTSFVRCIENRKDYNGLDTSLASRFHQGTYYWQYPYIPWMTLYPRKSRSNTGVVLGERERQALAKDWDDSFRGLFQLLRSKQCPYFYVCANNFTVLFRASDIGGCDDVHALMSPTTTGLRKALRDDGIEYRMPLKEYSVLSKNSTKLSNGKMTGDKLLTMTDDYSNCIDEDDESWIDNLDVADHEIRRIQSAHQRSLQAKDMSHDLGDASLILIEGVECQGFYSFLLNAKSTISNVGRLAGVPPTLLAPVAFPKASMNQIAIKSSKVRMDNVDYHSIELNGTILPTAPPYLCTILNESLDSYSFSMNSSTNTLAFTKATQILLEEYDDTSDSSSKENENIQNTDSIFTQRNLCDSGLCEDVLECICRTGPFAVALMERICFDKAHGYAWS